MDLPAKDNEELIMLLKKHNVMITLPVDDGNLQFHGIRTHDGMISEWSCVRVMRLPKVNLF